MKIILILMTFTFILNAKSFIVYELTSSQKVELSKKYSLTPLFSIHEQKFIKNIKRLKESYKIETDDIELEKTLLNLNIKYDENLKQKLFGSNPFEIFQWGLNNTGDTQREWTSDITANYTQGVLGEDIQSNNITETPKKIKVAVVDSGVDITHPDLKDSIISHPKECEDLELYKKCMRENSDRNFCKETYASNDNNGNGYPLDCHGWNIGGSDFNNKVTGNPTISDKVGHGTHVAGIIAAKDNDIGVRGVIQNVELIPIQVGVSSSDYGENEVATDVIAKGILYAIQAKADVINLSLGWNIAQDSTLMREMIQMAVAQNIFVVAAAGNDSHTAPVYPCSYEDVICVGAHDVSGKIADFSNKGAHIDLLAPGKKILSTWPTTMRSKRFTQDDNYEYMSGTSQAAPFVSGSIALLLNQGVNKNEIKSRLLMGTRQESKVVQFGNIDIKKSLEQSSTALIIPVQKSSYLSKWEEDEKGNYSFLLKLKNIGKESNAQEAKITPLNSEIEIVNSTLDLPKLMQNEVFETRIFFKTKDDINSQQMFTISFEKQEPIKLQLKSLNLLAPTHPMAQAINGETKLNGYTYQHVDNFYDSALDIIGVKRNGPRSEVVLLKQVDNGYNVSKAQKIPVGRAFYLKFSKVDIDLDQSPDYVITLVQIKSQDEKVTRFFVFDKDMNPKRFNILPQNTFANGLTAMPGNFYWMKKDDRMVPFWIGMGIRDESEREQATPWNTPIEVRRSHLYYFSKDGLRTFGFKDKNEFPIHALFQSNKSKLAGELFFITSNTYNFFKTYKLYKVKNGVLNFIKDFNLSPYMNLTQTTPFAMAKNSLNNAFFTQKSVEGAMNIISMEIKNGELETSFQQVKSKYSAIERILSFDGEKYIAQSNYSFINRESIVDSVINSNIIKHDLLRHDISLYLNNSHTFNLGSDFISINNRGEIYRPANKTFIGVEDCTEADLKTSAEKSVLTYICPENLKLINLEL